ncbi:MAG: hypothetical protein MRY74_13820 [Neomegalonema sp.]|nr:hypothetical protein [Neomegalonema sp.]
MLHENHCTATRIAALLEQLLARHSQPQPLVAAEAEPAIATVAPQAATPAPPPATEPAPKAPSGRRPLDPFDPLVMYASKNVEQVDEGFRVGVMTFEDRDDAIRFAMRSLRASAG